jgi:hypothetical protein
MSHLYVLICRVDEEVEEMTELASIDLLAGTASWSAAPLDAVEAQVATTGQHLLARLCELAWDEIDTAAVDVGDRATGVTFRPLPRSLG